MKAVIQRVKKSAVNVDGELIASIGEGLLVLLGVSSDDSVKDVDYLVDKICHLRIFESNGKMDLSLLQTGGEMMVVSQFTLLGDCRKGRRPSFTKAAPPETAKSLYELFIESAKKRGIRISAGQFGAFMAVSLINDGPVTLILDSRHPGNGS